MAALVCAAAEKFGYWVVKASVVGTEVVTYTGAFLGFSVVVMAVLGGAAVEIWGKIGIAI